MKEIKNIFLTEVSAEIKKPMSTLILCHRNPDPDTLGSAFALKILLERYGSSVRVACADEPHPRLSFITGGAELKYVQDSYERIIAVDVASPAQLGDLEFLAEQVDITIDHHAMNIRFSNYFELFCAACAEIIMELAWNELMIFDDLPKQFYICVYAGISGDTGCFKYSNTNFRTMTYGAKLLTTGIDHAEINRLIFDSKTPAEVRAQRLVYEKMELYCDGALAVVAITNEDKEKHGFNDNDIADIVTLLRSIEGVKLAVSIKQTKDKDVYSISSRSNCDIDVSAVCAKIGGGGHARAAGAKLTAPSTTDAVNKIVELFQACFKE